MTVARALSLCRRRSRKARKALVSHTHTHNTHTVIAPITRRLVEQSPSNPSPSRPPSRSRSNRRVEGSAPGRDNRASPRALAPSSPPLARVDRATRLVRPGRRSPVLARVALTRDARATHARIPQTRYSRAQIRSGTEIRPRSRRRIIIITMTTTTRRRVRARVMSCVIITPCMTTTTTTTHHDDAYASHETYPCTEAMDDCVENAMSSSWSA